MSRAARRSAVVEPLYLAILWHMHQPPYREVESGVCVEPWVRLRAIRDYLHMAEVLADYPAVHVTVNWVPSLLEQLTDYVQRGVLDPELALSWQESWSEEDRARLLARFFRVSEVVLRRYPPYGRLAQLREAINGEVKWLSDAYFRDLVAWFNLAWINARTVEQEPELAALAHKGAGFSIADIRVILRKQEALLRQVLPAYRALREAGQIEISTSPYYHPILPLLYNTDLAAETNPGLTLPSPPFAHPEDAREHLDRAVMLYKAEFGERPRGLWPPEGAVAEVMLPDVAAAGFTWLASDENVLARSLGLEACGVDGRVKPERLYQAYRVQAGDRKSLAIVFRDRALSDAISFGYARKEPRVAVDDLMSRLHAIADTTKGRPALVMIALDGENCWDYYEANGDVFLRCLYAALSGDRRLRTVTVSEYLAEHPPTETLPRLAAGTWAPNGFETWIGEPAQNQAWEMLRQARDDLVATRCGATTSREQMARAWNALYVAEASDWFWWYSHCNAVNGCNPFEGHFQAHLRAVYRHAGLILGT